MEGPAAALTVIACLMSAAGVGAYAHARLPVTVLTRPMTDLIHRGIWIVALMAGLTLAMMTVHVRTYFDDADQDVRRFSSQVEQFDHLLRRAGPAGEPARDLLFRYAARTMKDVWPETNPPIGPDDAHADDLLARLETSITPLRTAGPANAELAETASAAVRDLETMRWRLNGHERLQVATWMLPVVVFWLMLTFASLGLSAPRTSWAAGTLALLAVALGGAAFLMVEYADPYTGVIVVSSQPLQEALFTIGK
jgi:hypothetical protein